MSTESFSEVHHKPGNKGFEYSVHQCPPQFERELHHIFPNIQCRGIVGIPTMQHALCDLVDIGENVELEKDRLLNEFMMFGKDLCQLLSDAGYWADYIDPCSGLAMLTPNPNRVFSEVECAQLLLKYRTMNAGCCKVLLHPTWGSAVYPATVFCNAPKDVVHQIIGSYLAKEQIIGENE